MSTGSPKGSAPRRSIAWLLRPSRPAAGRRAAWARFGVGIAILVAFFWFLTTEPVPPGAAGEIIHRNLRENVQADALFYADLDHMPAIEQALARR